MTYFDFEQKECGTVQNIVRTITISRVGEAGGWLLPVAFFGPGVFCIVLALTL